MLGKSPVCPEKDVGLYSEDKDGDGRSLRVLSRENDMARLVVLLKDHTDAIISD